MRKVIYVASILFVSLIGSREASARQVACCCKDGTIKVSTVSGGACKNCTKDEVLAFRRELCKEKESCEEGVPKEEGTCKDKDD